jgi:hypothetical protein
VLMIVLDDRGRSAGLVRQPDRDAEPWCAGRGRGAVYQHAHDERARCRSVTVTVSVAAGSWLRLGSGFVKGLGGLGEGVSDGLVPVHVRAAGAELPGALIA